MGIVVGIAAGIAIGIYFEKWNYRRRCQEAQRLLNELFPGDGGTDVKAKRTQTDGDAGKEVMGNG